MSNYKYSECKHSLITEEIKLLIDANDMVLIEDDINNCFSNDGTYNWGEIRNYFDVRFSIRYDLDFQSTFTKDLCRQYVKAVRPILKQSESSLKKVFKSNKLLPAEIYSWLDNGQTLKQILETSDNSTDVNEKLLVLTSALENGLGNVYKTIERHSPPHLLRELLRTRHLSEFFGPVQIFFLQIIMGTPNSINLRNLIWHGFPYPGEIPSYYVSTLIIILLSLTKTINSKCLRVNLRFMETKIELTMDEQFLKTVDNSVQAIKDINQISCNCKYVKVPQREVWSKINKYFEEKDNPNFLLLILPQIEVLLRIIYGHINQLDIRAKLDEYYITLDTFFEEKSSEISGKLIHNELSEPTLKLIYDLFISPNGPRIRDKVSHGEINYINVPDYFCALLLSLAYSIMNGKTNNTHIITNYESYYHPNAVLYRKLLLRKSCLEQIKAIIPPKDMRISIEEQMKRIRNECSSAIISIGGVNIFHRPQFEGKVVNILMQIVEKLILTSENLLTSFSERIQLYELKQLRSKRRRTLENMFKSLPVIYEKLNLLWTVCEVLFCNFQNNKNYTVLELQDLIKFLKQALKIIENVENCCEKSNNEWEKVLQLWNNFEKVFNKYEKFFDM